MSDDVGLLAATSPRAGGEGHEHGGDDHHDGRDDGYAGEQYLTRHHDHHHTNHLGNRNRFGRRQDSTRIRSNITRGLQSLSRVSKVFLTVSLLASLTQIVVSAVTTGLTFNDECDTQLHLFVIVYGVRVLCSIPILIYQKLWPTESSLDDSDVSATSLWVERARSVLDIFTTVWFLVGNFWVYTSTFCSATSPLLYYTSMAFVVLGYAYLLLPLLLCGAMICCLPFVLILTRTLNVIESNAAAPDSVIKNLPTTKFKKGDIAEEDATCVICLSAYEDGEEIKSLPCKHHYHGACIDDWLHINQACPLCNRKVDGSSVAATRRNTNADEEAV